MTLLLSLMAGVYVLRSYHFLKTMMKMVLMQKKLILSPIMALVVTGSKGPGDSLMFAMCLVRMSVLTNKIAVGVA